MEKCRRGEDEVGELSGALCPAQEFGFPVCKEGKFLALERF